MTYSKYINHKDIEDIFNASNFSQPREVALRILERMPANVVGICDPISNHPTEAGFPTEKKETLFAKTTRLLIENGYVVFDDRPFFKKINELKDIWFAENKNEEICKAIVKEFFEPLLETKKIKKLILLPNSENLYIPYWEASYGASVHDIKVEKLPFNWGETFDLQVLAGLNLPKEQSAPEAGPHEVVESK